MVIAKIAANIGKGLIWDGIVRRISDFYERIKNEKAEDLERRIRQYRIKDDEAGIDHTVEELARDYHWEDRLTKLQNTVVENSRKYLGYATNLVSSMQENKGLHYYSTLERLTNYLSRVAPYIPGRIGKVVYAVDLASEYLEKFGNEKKKAQTLLFLAERLNERLIPYVVASKLRNAVREIKNLPPVGLERVLATAKDKIKSIPGNLVDYARRIKTKNPIYGFDFGTEAAPVYGAV